MIRSLVVSLSVAVGFCNAALAAEGAPREQANIAKGTVVRIEERQIGEGTNLVLIIKALESDRQATLIVPRKGDLPFIVRKLQPGQKVAARYVTEREQAWLTGIEVERPREGDKPVAKPGEGDKPREGGELQAAVRELRVQVERMKARIAELEAENLRLKRALAEAKGETPAPVGGEK